MIEGVAGRENKVEEKSGQRVVQEKKIEGYTKGQSSIYKANQVIRRKEKYIRKKAKGNLETQHRWNNLNEKAGYKSFKLMVNTYKKE